MGAFAKDDFDLLSDSNHQNPVLLHLWNKRGFIFSALENSFL
jgi:hypothetical protein